MTAPDATSGYRLWLYAAPALALAIPTIPVTVLLPAFYSETHGLGLTAVAFALGAARLIDVCCDPLVGLLSDRTRTGFGRRKPWIVGGAVFAGLALVRLLDPPANPGIVHLLCWSVVLYVGWSIVQIPYQSWGAEVTGAYHGRARIAGAREAFGIAGIVFASAFPAASGAAGLSEADGLAALAWVAVAPQRFCRCSLSFQKCRRRTRRLSASAFMSFVRWRRTGPFGGCC
jgi:GPH family glycoside/pentoside/hexuronide:cation symporter